MKSVTAAGVKFVKPLRESGNKPNRNMIKAVADKVKNGAAAMELAKQAPILTIFAVFSFGSLWFMERRDTMWGDILKRDEEARKEHLAQYHSIQEESNAALKAVAEALQSHAIAFNEVSIRLQNLDR